MNLYRATVPQFVKMLENLDRWLDKAKAHATAKGFDPNVLVSSRLAPDQYPLSRQIQAACDMSKFACARLTGKEAPKHADTEQTIDELRTRLQTVITYLGTFTAEEFVGAEDRRILLPFLEGKALRGEDYVVEMILPNVYFHVTTAYAILRHNGVGVGKRDFIGAMTFCD